MRAVTVDPEGPNAVRLADLPEPDVGSNQVLVEVHHAALNRGDLNDAQSGRVSPGGVLGSDAAGVVVGAASSGDGPSVGTPVVALTPAAFGERVAVDIADLAEVPPQVDLAAAAALPVAGLAALRALRTAGSPLGRRVLVTGARGGVGWFAIQLAARAGAEVIASVRSTEHDDDLAEAGADHVVVGLEGVDRPVDLVLDTVGGPRLVEAWTLLAPGGVLQSIGWTSNEPAVFPPYSTVGPAKSLSSFLNESPYGRDLATLVALLARGGLDVSIGWRGSVEEFQDAANAMRERRLRGKAILSFAAAPVA